MATELPPDGLYLVEWRDISASFEVRDGRLVRCAPVLRKNLDRWVKTARRIR